MSLDHATTPAPATGPGGVTAPGHTPDGRLVAQRVLFSGPQPVCPVDLYAQVKKGSVARERGELAVGPHSRVTTDTYFGRFPASYWQRWTAVGHVELTLDVDGACDVELWVSNEHGKARPVDVTRVDDARTVSFRVALDTFVDGGHVWFDLTTGATPLTVRDARWTVDAPADPRRSSVVICTFNRADDCVRTLAALASDAAPLEVLDTVHVVDQGTDTVESRAGFPDAERALGGRLRYLRQPNLGGAGGFGRGMYEITAGPESTDSHVLLTDDDVLCEPELVLRLTAFANSTVEPTIVGGQMLRLFAPSTLLAGAERADFAQLVPGQVVDGALADVDLLAPQRTPSTTAGPANPSRPPHEVRKPVAVGDLEDQLKPVDVRGDRRVDADYNAWWSCLIPAAVVRRVGLPLPLFFQWDDVEYGYRARRHGIATVTLPGAGLWHADFDRKDPDKWGEYFAVRNAMIVTAIHADIDPKRTARVITSRVTRALLGMQYGLAATILQAADDYLRGPANFTDGGAEAAAAIHRVRAAYPDTVLHRASDVTAHGAAQLVSAPSAPRRARVVLAKRLANLALGRTTHDVGAVPHADSAWWHVSQFGTAIVTDASQSGVRVRTFDRATSLRLAKRTAAWARRFLAEQPRVRAAYRAAAAEVTTRDNWERLYGLQADRTRDSDRLE